MIHVKKNTVKDAVVGPKSSKTASNLSADDKRANRLTELKSEFQIVRAMPFSVAVNMYLNKPKEEPKREPTPVIEDRPPTQEAKGKPAAKKKK